MITILFGAGASYGSDNAGTPPLGNSLYDELKVFAPRTWGQISGQLSQIFKSDFETGMVELVKKSQFAAPLQWDMAEYFYKRFQIAKSNKYIELLNTLSAKSNEIILSTLNYDTLLFQAASYVKLQMSIGSSNPASNGFVVNLPHGSSVIYCESVKAQGNITFVGNVASSGSIKLFSNLNEFIREKQTNRFPPVMSYYEPNKFTPSGAQFIQSQRKDFCSHIKNSSQIVIIGTRVHLLDKHIWEPLANASGRILYFGGPQGKVEFDQWQQQSGRSGDISMQKYFADSIKDIKSFLAL